MGKGRGFRPLIPIARRETQPKQTGDDSCQQDDQRSREQRVRKAMAQKRCHCDRANDLADGVSAGQQCHGTGEAEQPPRREGHRAHADEGGTEQDCAYQGCDHTRRQSRQRDTERLQQ
jgi:hypothetical protein